MQDTDATGRAGEARAAASPIAAHDEPVPGGVPPHGDAAGSAPQAGRTRDVVPADATDADVPALLDDAADLLASRFGGRPELGDPEDLGGSGDALVLRVRVAPNPFLPERSVVVKQLAPAAAQGVEPAVLREIAAYQFTTALPADVRPGPVLLAHDVDRRLVIITDVGDGVTFADVLTRREPEPGERINALRMLGHALGRMHAGTAEREAGFDSLARRMWRAHRDIPGLVLGGRDRGIVRSIDLGLALLEHRGVSVPREVRALVEEAVRRISDGFHRAFTPFELLPDNILFGGGAVNVLDYEWAGYRDVGFDLANVIAGFPRNPRIAPLEEDEVRVLLDAWMSEVRRTWPDIEEEDTLGQRITVGLLGWTLIMVTVMHIGSVDQGLETEAAIERRLAGQGYDVDDRDEGVVAHLARTLAAADEGEPPAAGRATVRSVAATARVLRAWAEGRRTPSPALAAFAADVAEIASAGAREGAAR
ncbi:phosphotransferase [Corynebacterium sp. 335C]